MYGIIRVSLGELGMHRKGVDHARLSNLEAESLVRPEIIKGELSESSSYISTPHIHRQPGYYPAYFIAALYKDALSHSLKQKNGTIVSPLTAKCFIENIMIGNVTSMENRISKVIGETDFIGSSIELFKNNYKDVS